MITNHAKKRLQQVYNLATSGLLVEYTEHWIEKEKCVLTNGRRSVDNRTLNMTAFRIQMNLLVLIGRLCP